MKMPLEFSKCGPIRISPLVKTMAFVINPMQCRVEVMTGERLHCIVWFLLHKIAAGNQTCCWNLLENFGS